MARREPRAVGAGAGLQWARQGVQLLAAAPAVWVGITLLFLLIGVALGVIPFAGLLWSVAVPMHAGGLMLGCRALREGRPLEVRYLFSGFEAPRYQPLALLGALYLGASLVVMLPLILLAVGSALASAFALSTTGGHATSLVGVGVVALMLALLAMVGMTALSLALWFAPALVVFDEVPALDALKLSLRAGWANVAAFIVFGVVLLGVALVVVSPALAAILLLAARGEQAGAWAAMVIGGTALGAVLCAVLIVPATWGAMYASYEDVFGDGGHVKFDI